MVAFTRNQLSVHYAWFSHGGHVFLCNYIVQEQIQEDAELLWPKSPCYQHLLKEFGEIKQATYCNTLIITGPKGCGKTSALKLLASHLRGIGDKVYYVDLGMDLIAVDILQSLQPLAPCTLLIDSLQLVDDYMKF